MSARRLTNTENMGRQPIADDYRLDFAVLLKMLHPDWTQIEGRQGPV